MEQRENGDRAAREVVAFGKEILIEREQMELVKEMADLVKKVLIGRLVFFWWRDTPSFLRTCVPQSQALQSLSICFEGPCCSRN